MAWHVPTLRPMLHAHGIASVQGASWSPRRPDPNPNLSSFISYSYEAQCLGGIILARAHTVDIRSHSVTLGAIGGLLPPSPIFVHCVIVWYVLV